jgi:hypothetical protein
MGRKEIDIFGQKSFDSDSIVGVFVYSHLLPSLITNIASETQMELKASEGAKVAKL